METNDIQLKEVIVDKPKTKKVKEKVKKEKKKKKKENDTIPEKIAPVLGPDEKIHLTTHQMEQLWYAYRKIESNQEGIDQKSFQKAFDIKDADFAKRLFKALDTNGNGLLSYDELLRGLSAMHVDAKKEEKMKFLLRLYELNEEQIDRDTFIRLLKDSLRQNRVNVKESHLITVADAVFTDKPNINVKEMLHDNGVTSAELTLSISSSMQMYLERCKTATTIENSIQKEVDILQQKKQRTGFQAWFYQNVTKRFRHPTAWYFLIGYILINLGLAAWKFTDTYLSPAFDLFGWSVVISRSMAGPLYFNCSMVIIMASKHFLTWLRQYPILFQTIPFDYTHHAHRNIGWAILIMALVHAGAHYRNFYVLSTSPLDEINKYLLRPWSSSKSYVQLVFADFPGLTGHIMLLYFLVVYPFAILRKRGVTLTKPTGPQVVPAGSPKLARKESEGMNIRKSIDVRESAMVVENKPVKKEFKSISKWRSILSYFNLFFITHRLFIVFYTCLILHGFGYYLAGPNFIYWFIIPGLIYVISFAVSNTSTKYKVRLQKAKILPPSVIMLQFPKPPRFDYYPGQYLYIRCPKLSNYEYHPFSFTSAPHEDFIRVHIDVRGAWTSRLYDLITDSDDLRKLKFFIEGPYGAPAQHFDQYKTVVLIGAGIGVTPFSSVLREIHKLKQTDPNYKVERVYFYWIARDYRNFEWFEDLLNKLALQSDMFKIHMYFTGALSPNDMRSVLLQVASNVTYKEKSHCFVTGMRTRTHFGRPDISQVVRNLQSKYSDHDVGLFACGPPALTKEFKSQCKLYPNMKFYQEYF